jgi:hypothetical protein
MQYTPDEILDLCVEHLPLANNLTDLNNIRMAGRFAWEQKEMGGLEYVQFAYRNNTPIVPPGHCGHPLELVKRGFIDGEGWPKEKTIENRIKLFRWFEGKHWYAKIDGEIDVVDKRGNQKWNTSEQAMKEAKEFIDKLGK